MNYSKIFPVREYYRRYIIPLNPDRYKETSTTMVCPVHNDHDPSLGIINSRKDGEVCHCFGCNFWGNIIELHQRVNRHHFRKYLTVDEAKLELCNIFDVDYDSLPKDLQESADKYTLQEAALDNSVGRFDISDFRYKILEGKQKKKQINYFNTLLMIMVNEVKQLEVE